MASNKNFVEDFYNKLRNNAEYRAYVMNNPKEAMCELHGIEASSIANVDFEIIEQEENTITIMIPSRPDDYKPDQKLVAKKISNQTIDFMYKRGIPGFLIPNNNLRWTMLNMRCSWALKEGIDL